VVLSGWMRLIAGVQGAGAVLAQIPIPTVAVARDPGVNEARDKMDAGDEKQPGNEIPSGQGEADARPGISTGENAAARIHSLHQAHGFFPVNLRKARGGFRIVQVELCNARPAVHAAQARDACATKPTVAIVENR